ncbi:MAG: hypothetical protein J6B77_00580 [Clostridia bacterium]|nr:hypothetical protein [Clostridia bacterium]
MTFHLFFSGSLYDTEIIVKDSDGTHRYFMPALQEEEASERFLDVEAASGDFELTLIPQMTDYRSALSEMEIENWKDKHAKKAANTLCSFLDHTLLRVGCTYRVSGLSDGDSITVDEQTYIFGTFDRFDFLELIPMAYMFYEASSDGCRFPLSDAFPTNRKKVISSARKIALIDFGLHLIVTYPFQVGRIKRLSKSQKVRRTLIRFNKMDETERRAVLDRMERFMEK